MVVGSLGIIEIVTIFQEGQCSPNAYFFIGTSLVIVGALVREWCFHILGSMFTFEIGIVQDKHHLVDTGPYAVVRYVLLLNCAMHKSCLHCQTSILFWIVFGVYRTMDVAVSTWILDQRKWIAGDMARERVRSFLGRLHSSDRFFHLQSVSLSYVLTVS